MTIWNLIGLILLLVQTLVCVLGFCLLIKKTSNTTDVLMKKYEKALNEVKEIEVKLNEKNGKK